MSTIFRPHEFSPGTDRGRAWATGSEPYDPTLEGYIREAPPDAADHGLCHVCNTIDFAAICAIDPATIVADYRENQGRVYHVFRLSHLENGADVSCPLCRMICWYRELRRKLSTLTKDDACWMLALRPVYDYNGHGFIFFQLTLAEDDSKREPVSTTWGDLGYDELLLYDIVKSGDDITGDLIDTEWLSAELRDCETTHDGRPSRPAVPGMKLIDCFNSTVVDATTDKEYLALSYVWSHPTSSTGPSPGFSFSIKGYDLPPTIRDAMALTLKLGKRYLWVDRLCIDQADHDGKKTQIAAMHEIYGQAWATIVSLMPDDTYALPGVTTRRSNRCSIPTNSGTLLLRGLLKTEIDSTVWASRAWVFQEAYMSRRVIFVSEARAVLACPYMVLEEVPSHIDPAHQVRMQWAFANGDGSDRRHQPTNVYPWDRTISDTTFDTQHFRYCRRSMTYESDALNGLRGYLAKCGWDSFWGIPIYPMTGYESPPSCPRLSLPLAGFTVGLMWRRAVPGAAHNEHTNNEKFPSWTWASARPNSQYFEVRGAPHRSVVFAHVSFIRDVRVVHPEMGGLLDTSYSDRIHLEDSTRSLRIRAPTVRLGADLAAQLRSRFPDHHFEWRKQTVYDDYKTLHTQSPTPEQSLPQRVGQQATQHTTELAVLIFADQLGVARKTPNGPFYSWTLYWLIVADQGGGEGGRFRRTGVITVDLGVSPGSEHPVGAEADEQGRATTRQRVAESLSGLRPETVVVE